MLKGYYSNSNFGVKLSLLILIFTFFIIISSILGNFIFTFFFNTSAASITSHLEIVDKSDIIALKIVQALSLILNFLIPSVLYLYLTKEKPSTYLGFDKKINIIFYIITIVIYLAALPIIAKTFEWNKGLVFPEWMKSFEDLMLSMDKSNEKITNAFLSTVSIGGFIINVLLIALLPAVAEEFVFRGILIKGLNSLLKNVHIAVIISAIIFSAVHFQILGFLPRFILGLILGYLFVTSKSLILPIFFHFINNFTSILIDFLNKRGTITSTSEDIVPEVNTLFLITAEVVIILMFIAIKRYIPYYSKKNII